MLNVFVKKVPTLKIGIVSNSAMKYTFEKFQKHQVLIIKKS